MEGKVSNRTVLEKIAKDVLHIEDPEKVEAFIYEFVYSMLFW